ncbi:MAG: nuclear transport factor 2 family protein [bacterium]
MEREDEAEAGRRLEVLWAEREIDRVILTYARGLDDLDFDRVRSCFHADARIHYDDWFSGSLEEGLAWLEDSLPRLGGTLHGFGRPLIDLDLAAGVADCETVAINSALHPPDARGVRIQNVSGTLYRDRFEHRGGRWAIAERRSRRVWRQNGPVGEDPPLPGGGSRKRGWLEPGTPR